MIIKNNKLPDSFIKIQQSEWANSIDILFDPRQYINKIDLFLCIKYYYNTELFIVKVVYMAGERTNQTENKKEFPTFYKIQYNTLKRMNFRDFDGYIEELLITDSHYINTVSYYGFRFVFYQQSPNIIEKKIYPKYPWDDEFKKKFIRTDHELEAEVQYLHNIIKKNNEKK